MSNFPPCTKPPLTDADRRRLSDNQFVDLSSGTTHVEVAGPPGGRPVIFVHGLTSPMFIWDEQFEVFAGRGYRVYRYDLFGRGLSDRPEVRYGTDLFVRQLRDLVDWIDPSEPMVLAGLSLGGGIVTEFTARHGDRVDCLFLVAPAGLPETMPWWYYLISAPVVAEVFYYTLGEILFRSFGHRNLTTNPDRRARASRAMTRQLEFGGYLRAIISTLRHGPVYGLGDSYETVGEMGCPVRAIWSRTDDVVPFELHERLEELVPQVELRSLEEGQHTINYDRPEPVNGWLREFLEA